MKIMSDFYNPGHPDENELAQYAEFLRFETGSIPEELIAHVESCSYCRAELMAITDMLDELPDLDEVGSGQPAVGSQQSAVGSRQSAVGSQQVRRSVISILRAAAAIAAVFLIAWIVQQTLPGRLHKEQLASDTQNPIPDTRNPIPDTRNPTPDTRNLTPETRNPIPDTLLYAAAYIPNPAFENLVAAKYRSGTDPAVQGPDPGKIFAPGDTLKISWTPQPDESYQLVILDNKSNMVKEIKAGPDPHLTWKIDLKPGLYYWKFLGREEMWKVGRLKVISSK